MDDENGDRRERPLLEQQHQSEQTMLPKTFVHSLSHIIGRDSVPATTLVGSSSGSATKALQSSTKPGSKLAQSSSNNNELGRVKLGTKINKLVVKQSGVGGNFGSDSSQAKQKASLNHLDDGSVNNFSSAEKVARVPKSKSKCLYQTTGKKNATLTDNSLLKSEKEDKKMIHSVQGQP